jgi:hypothetical protein
LPSYFSSLRQETTVEKSTACGITAVGRTADLILTKIPISLNHPLKTNKETEKGKTGVPFFRLFAGRDYLYFFS